jgi:segregation and condensation protein B
VQEHLFEPIPFKQIVEGLIFASREPVSIEQIVQALMAVDPDMSVFESEIPAVIEELNGDYHVQGRSFRIIERGGGYTFKTNNRLHKWLQHIQHENTNRKLTQSAIETLAIVAYKQPITKPVVDSIRGVDSGHMVRQLLEKGLIEVAGRADTPGRPLLYKTSPLFLSHFGLRSMEDLPKPREIDEILKDDDMAEHRQIMLELKAELYSKPTSHS